MVAIITSEQAAAELLGRRKAEDSLYEFLQQAWLQIEGGRPFKGNWHLEAKCEHLEALLRGDIRNLLINEPPRFTKSTLCNVALPAFAWIKQPGLQWLFSSYAWTLVLRDSRRCRTLMDSKWYQARWGDRFQLMEDANRMDRFYNDKRGYRLSTSVDSATMGDGGDIQVADDPNNTRDLSDTMLQSALDWWHHVMPSRVNDFMTCRRLVIQQRTHEKDLSGDIISHDLDGSWTKLIIPMEFEESRRCVTVKLPSTMGRKWQDPRTTNGELLDPNRVGPKELKQLKKDLGSEYAIAGQLQQRPAPEAGGIIKRAWFKIWEQREAPECEYVVLSIDTALSDAKSSAYSAATTWGVFKDGNGIPNALLLSVWRERCEYPELRNRIQRMAADYLDDGPIPVKSPNRKPDLVLIEAKANGISLIQDLNRAGVLATKFNPDKLGDKTQRVRLVTPLFEAGRVWVPGAPPDFRAPRRFAETFVTQCVAFPNAESRDLVDTVTMALWRLSSSGWIFHKDDVRDEPRYREKVQGPIYG